MDLSNYEIDFCEGALRQLSLDPRAPSDLMALAAGILTKLETPAGDFRQQKRIGLVEKHGEIDSSDGKRRLKTTAQRDAYKAELSALSMTVVTVRKFTAEESELFSALRIALWLSRANAAGDDPI